jgi:hypothetical protein
MPLLPPPSTPPPLLRLSLPLSPKEELPRVLGSEGGGRRADDDEFDEPKRISEVRVGMKDEAHRDDLDDELDGVDSLNGVFAVGGERGGAWWQCR